MVTMISRWIPRMVSRGHSVYDSQEALIGGYDQSKTGRIRRGLRMATYTAGFFTNLANGIGTVVFLAPIATSWPKMFGRIKEKYQIGTMGG